MLGYQHTYHAGNFADVHKHALLLAALALLPRNPHVVDTHAGRGVYGVDSPEARKTGEWRTGIGKLMQAKQPGTALASYIAAVGKDMREYRYPGSVVLAARFVGAQGRVHAFETHPAERTALKKSCRSYPQVTISDKDGYVGAAMVCEAEPPHLVFIDPSFEKKDEFAKAAMQAHAFARAGAMAMLWYPVLAGKDHHVAVHDHAAQNARIDEIIYPSLSKGMIGAGVAVWNAPSQYAPQAGAITQAVAAILGGRVTP